MPIEPEDFRTFFGELYKDQEGTPLTPFPWQERLAARACRGDWPECIAVPTASGKTACIDIAVFAMACQADRGERRTAPRRIFFVVDRRVIVDEAFTRATRLARQLKQASDGLLKHVADRLRLLAGGGHYDPLECHELRGGVYRDNVWVRTPLQPAVICSTVDQIGSRLLFRGYGVSPLAAPIHAAMAANDSLIVLDEAHCSNPFRQTADSIRRYRDWAEEPLKSPFHLVVMSATPGQDFAPDKVLRLDEDETNLDREHPALRPRLDAPKPTRLVVAAKAKGHDSLGQLAEFIAKEAKALAKDDVRAVGIIVNRVATARMIYDHLTPKNAKGADHEAVLLTGRMRPYDKDRTIAEWQERIEAKPGRPPLERPVFIVSTQCLEVGANLDFDALISECASLDALRQRFGRLNRLGLRQTAPGVIVIQKAQEGSSDDDPIYGKTLCDTWKWLTLCARDDSIDMGVRAIDEIVERSGLDARTLCNVQPDAPIMLPAYVDRWVQTAPIPRPDPDVSLFLHGPDQREAEVQVVWRADLDEPAEFGRWLKTISLCPPAIEECLPVQLRVLRKWWWGEESASQDASDMEGTRAEQTDDQQPSRERSVRGLVWRGCENSRMATRPDDLAPGDTLVLPVSAGGWDVLGYVPDADTSGAAPDIAELVDRPAPVLRVHECLKTRWLDWPGYHRLLDIAKDATVPDKSGAIRRTLGELAAEAGLAERLKTVLVQFAGDRRLSVISYPGDEEKDEWSGMVLTGSRAASGRRRVFSDEDDTSSAGSRPVSLDAHNAAVAQMAEQSARLCGLPEGLRQCIRLAAEIHDVGKADPRFQAWLHGGNRRKADLHATLLAKSAEMPRNAREYAVARRKSGYPKGGRHELLSVRLAECGSALSDDCDRRELVLHLVGAHHGHCRPFAPVVADQTPVAVSLQHEGNILSASSATNMERLDSGAAERFWCMVHRYGWWGAAYLETILRLADWSVSEMEATKETPL